MSNNILWTGESIWCQCGHHIDFHFTVSLLTFDKTFCSFTKDNQGCPCSGFRPYKVKEIVK